MAFDLPDRWVWDFWLVEDDGLTHLFFLQAPRSLGDPELRHRNAGVGHAVSADLRSWRVLPDALAPAPFPAYDDLAVWTGSVVRGDDGLWRMFSSGLSRADDGRVQRIGLATSPDLTTWTRRPGPPYPLEAEPRWYDVSPPVGEDLHWRDPWLVRDAGGAWHMYVTAKERGSGRGRGVAGHAVSRDLESWTVTAPLGAASGHFDQLEVIQVVEVDTRWYCVFSCLAGEMPGASPGDGGVWCVEVDGPGAPIDLRAAYRLTSERWYVGKLARLPSAGSARPRWALLAFHHRDDEDRFVGGISDPMPVVRENGRLVVRDRAAAGLPPD